MMSLLYTSLSQIEQKPGNLLFDFIRQWWALGCFAICLAVILAQPQSVLADEPLVTQEIRYFMPDAGQVNLVWGVNGWQPVREELRPAGTTLDNRGIMSSPMTQTGEAFSVQVQVPVGSKIDFGFFISQTRSDADVSVWEGVSLPIIAAGDGIVDLETRYTFAAGEVLRRIEGTTLVTQEIRYQVPQAEQKVFLVWGIDGWVLVPEAIRPTGTYVQEGLMHTPMTREGNDFVARIQVPFEDKVGYKFLIERTTGDQTVKIWDTNGDQGYQVIANAKEIPAVSYISQEIRNYLPNAGEMFLVWGINGWNPLPEAIRPPGTTLVDAKMYTPMRRNGETFVTHLQVPEGAKIDFAFLVTKARSGSSLERWISNDEENYAITAVQGGVFGINSSGLEGEEERTGLIKVAIYLALGSILVLIIGAILFLSPIEDQRSGLITLIILTLFGLGLRLAVVWLATHRSPDSLAQLSTGELNYEAWATLLAQGDFLKWPGRAPLYPFFVGLIYLVSDHSLTWVFYGQTLIGIFAIPLTYQLSQYFVGKKLSLFAAALIAIHPILIYQITRLSDVTVYTTLLLLVLLSLMWALERPSILRFLVTGLVLGGATLTRPLTLFFPVLILILLPGSLKFRRKAGLLGVCAAAMMVVIGPWSTYNDLVHKSFFPVTGSGAALWQGSPEFYNLVTDQVPATDIWNRYLNPENNGGHNPATSTSDEYFNERALESIKNEPGAYAIYSLLKLPLFWIGHPAFDWPDYGVFDMGKMSPYYSPIHIAGILATRLLPVVALLALIILHELHGRVRYLGPLLAVIGYFMLVYAVTYPEVSFSVPLHPILVTIIVAAIRPKEIRLSLDLTAPRQWRYT